MKCRNCNTENLSTAKFCNHCGQKFELLGRTCPNSGCNRSGLPEEAMFCPDCGEKLCNEFTKQTLDNTDSSPSRMLKKNENYNKQSKKIVLIVVAVIITISISSIFYYQSSYDNKIEAIDQSKEVKANNWELIRKLNDVEFVSSLSISPDGGLIAGADEEKVKIWNSNTGECLLTLSGGTTYVNSVTYSSDGKFIASGSNEFIKIFDANSGSCLQSIKTKNDNIESLKYSKDGTYVISGSFYSTIELWKASSGNLVRTFYTDSENPKEGGSADVINSIAISNDGYSFASGHSNNRIKIWNIQTGKCVRTIRTNDGINAVCYSPDGKNIASGGDEKTIRIYNSKSGFEIISLNGHSHNITAISYSADGKYIMSGDGNSGEGSYSVKIWDTSTSKCLRTIECTGSVMCISCSPNSKYFAYSCLSSPRTVALNKIE